MRRLRNGPWRGGGKEKVVMVALWCFETSRDSGEEVGYGCRYFRLDYLVAATFLGWNWEVGRVVHRDTNGMNCCAENLMVEQGSPYGRRGRKESDWVPRGSTTEPIDEEELGAGPEADYGLGPKVGGPGPAGDSGGMPVDVGGRRRGSARRVRGLVTEEELGVLAEQVGKGYEELGEGGWASVAAVLRRVFWVRGA